MSPRPRPNSRAAPSVRLARVAAALAILAAIAMLAAACTAARFEPTGPCSGDGSASGAYPDLEAQAPRAFRGTEPTQIDSGRTCTTEALGTLAGHGITELRFAGSTWSTGTDSGLSLATFRSEGATTLTRDLLIEFYAAGASQGKNVTSVDQSDYP